MNVLWILGLNLELPWWFMWIILPIVTYFIYMSWNLTVFDRLGLPCRGRVPIFGCLVQMSKEGQWKYDLKHLEGPKIIGEFFAWRPAIYIRDLDMCREIYVKEFANFINRPVFANFSEAPLDVSLLALTDSHWKQVRNIISPTFSAGKMKLMTKHINLASVQFVENLSEKYIKGESLDVKEYAGAFSMDVIAGTAFGIQVNSLQDNNSEFLTQGKAMNDYLFNSSKMALWIYFPFIYRFFKNKSLSSKMQKSIDFFVTTIQESLKQREEMNMIQNDFLQLLKNAQNDNDNDNKEVEEKGDANTKTALTEQEVLGNSLLFFLAGYETTSSTLSFLIYNLALNPDVQDKLYEEIQEVVHDKDEVTYDMTTKMTYLEMCLSESLRIFPPGHRAMRECNADCTINGLFIPKGMLIIIPAYAIHMDPDLWPNPSKFDPERFTTEEKAKQHPYQYQPWGHGPRNCVGMRLAIMEIKIALIHMLRKFKVVRCAQTQDPPKLHPFRLLAELNLKLEERAN